MYKVAAVILLVVGFTGCGSHDPQAKSQEALLVVMLSAYEKNPEGIQAQLEEDSDQARDIMRRIILAQPSIETVLRENDMWERRDEMFEFAFTAFLEEKLPAAAVADIAPATE